MLVPMKIRESHVKNQESYTGFLSLENRTENVRFSERERIMSDSRVIMCDS